MKEIEILKLQSLRTKDKIGVFIKLIRNYAKKLSALCQSISPFQDEKGVNSALVQTIEQFYQMIFNSKLNESVFDLSYLLNEESNFPLTNNSISSPINNHYEPNKEINSLMSKYEEKLKLMNEEKNNYLKTIEGLQNQANILTKMNKDYEYKINIIEGENKSLKEDIKLKREKAEKFDLVNNKLSTLETELKYKENIISYLENLLKTNKFPQNIEEESSQDDYLAYHNQIKNDEYEKCNPPKQIKKEIDTLDEEINELKEKLRSMLNKK